MGCATWRSAGRSPGRMSLRAEASPRETGTTGRLWRPDEGQDTHATARRAGQVSQRPRHHTPPLSVPFIGESTRRQASSCALQYARGNTRSRGILPVSAVAEGRRLRYRALIDTVKVSAAIHEHHDRRVQLQQRLHRTEVSWAPQGSVRVFAHVRALTRLFAPMKKA
jgi:hypothetical protein